MIARIARALLRSALMAHCWTTMMYACVVSSTFAYLQFIKPRVFGWVALFADWHTRLSWIWLLALVACLWPHLRREGRDRRLACGLVVWCAALVVANATAAVVPQLVDGTASIVIGIVALTPLFGLALIDHVRGWRHVGAQTRSAFQDSRGGSRGVDGEQREGRLFAACLGSAVLLTAGYAVLASLSIAGAFEPDLRTYGLAVGVVSSLLGHLIVFGALFAAVALLTRAGGRSVARQYVLLSTGLGVVLTFVFARLVGDPMGLRGNSELAASIAIAASIVASWGGMRIASQENGGDSVASGLDILLSVPARGQSYRLVIPLVAVLPLAWGFARLSSRADWDFAVLKSGVVIVWVVTFALLYRASAPRRVGTIAAIAPFAAAIAVHAAWHPAAADEHVRERYVVHNPSFRVTDALLNDRPRSQTFDRYLRANTGLTDVAVQPVSIDLAPRAAPATERPNIFLFVVDSLRADYLSPYNPAVHFTPNIAAFAGENVALRNAFTRYGGTGLSMPALWAGSVLAHKQYVTPFATMNSLERLVDGNGYRRIQTHDHITEALWSGTDTDVELQRGRAEMDFDFCATVDELGAALESRRADPRPVFAQTRSLNLHVAEVRNGYVPPGRSYPGFEPPYAYRVERIDGCFGRFIERLRQLGLYDRSIVVLTADHGELIGEDGRWGHSYHLFPQVIQVPMFVHFPSAMAARSIDVDAVALSTDITPTLYTALGLPLNPPDALAGHSLFDRELSDHRREEAIVLSASYGAVYAVLSHNGRRLYIADAIQEREYAYERRSDTDLRWLPVDVTPGRRALEQLRIRRHIDTVARTYRIDRSY